MTGADATHRVYLHVGSAKTGTTYLQGLLWHHRAALREGGIDYVAEAPGEHFLAAIDLRDVPFAGARRPAAKGKWAAVAGRARDAEGTAVISHEVFAPTPADVAARAIADLAPAEVHLVLTTRDLLRQVTADWQERIKHGGRITFAEYVDTVLDPETTRTARRNGDPLSSFWQAQDAADVLGRWATTVPPAHVHVVTVPPPGSPRQLLWERFTTALGIDPGVYGDEGVTRDNTSLGRAETELLRRVNVALDGRLKMPAYGRIAKDRLAHTVLSARRTSPRLVLPAELREPIAAQATEIVATLRARGYDVVGDLDDLLPDPSGGTADSAAPPTKTRTARPTTRWPTPASTRLPGCCSSWPPSGIACARLASPPGPTAAGTTTSVTSTMTSSLTSTATRPPRPTTTARRPCSTARRGGPRAGCAETRDRVRGGPAAARAGGAPTGRQPAQGRAAHRCLQDGDVVRAERAVGRTRGACRAGSPVPG